MSDWAGWARYGRNLGSKWHRVTVTESGDSTIVQPVCGAGPMRSTTLIMGHDWEPNVDRCMDCWPAGTPHPGTIRGGG